jgi:hypothetical protein
MSSPSPFDSALPFHAEAVERGRKKGEDLGREEGFAQGEAAGLEAGFQAALELGFIRGCCVAWASLAEDDQSIPERARRSLESLIELTSSIPRENSVDVDLISDLQRCRAKFRAVSSMMRSPVTFRGGARSAETAAGGVVGESMSF